MQGTRTEINLSTAFYTGKTAQKKNFFRACSLLAKTS